MRPSALPVTKPSACIPARPPSSSTLFAHSYPNVTSHPRTLTRASPCPPPLRTHESTRTGASCPATPSPSPPPPLRIPHAYGTRRILCARSPPHTSVPPITTRVRRATPLAEDSRSGLRRAPRCIPDLSSAHEDSNADAHAKLPSASDRRTQSREAGRPRVARRGVVETLVACLWAWGHTSIGGRSGSGGG